MNGLSLTDLVNEYQHIRGGTRAAARAGAIAAILEGFEDLDEARSWYNELACRGWGFVKYTAHGFPVSPAAFRAAIRSQEAQA